MHWDIQKKKCRQKTKQKTFEDVTEVKSCGCPVLAASCDPEGITTQMIQFLPQCVLTAGRKSVQVHDLGDCPVTFRFK